MPIIVIRTLEIVCSSLPRIVKALELIAVALTEKKESEE